MGVERGVQLRAGRQTGSVPAGAASVEREGEEEGEWEEGEKSE